MKKFFTLFALLSVSLSAWADDLYRLEFRELNGPLIFAHDIKLNHVYSMFVYLSNADETWYDIDVYQGDEIIINDKKIDLSGGWYKFMFHLNSTTELNFEMEKGPISEIEFTDGSIFANAGPITDPITFTRDCSNKWGTLCLPFQITTEKHTDVTFYSFDKVEGDVMYFNIIEEPIPAGTPVIFKFNNAPGKLTIEEEGQGEAVIELNAGENTSSSWTLHGTFEYINSGSDTYYYLSKDTEGEGIFYGTNITVLPYHAWFTGPTPSGAPLRITVDDTEGLQFVEQEDGTVKVSYDLQGRKLDDVRKGLMIENGKIIMVK